MLNGLNTELGENYIKKRKRTKQDVQFINVDLEVWSKNDLQVLIDVLGEKVLDMGHFRFDNGNFLASFELGYDEIKTWENVEPDEVISKFCDLIETLPANGKILWTESYKRVFDIGFESGNTEKSFNTEIKTETLRRVHELGASIVITIYPVLNYTLAKKETVTT